MEEEVSELSEIAALCDSCKQKTSKLMLTNLSTVDSLGFCEDCIVSAATKYAEVYKNVKTMIANGN